MKNTSRKHALAMLMFLAGAGIGAQTKPADTIVVTIGKGSKMQLTIADRRDLETMKFYNFQALINDLIRRLEQNDTSRSTTPASSYLTPTSDPSAVRIPEPLEMSSPNSVPVRPSTADSVWIESWPSYKKKNGRHRRTYHSMNLDLGTNNFLQNGDFVDAATAPYHVRPWGSWYVGMNSVQRTHVVKKLFLEWSLGVSFYNFKFQNDNLRIVKEPETISFIADDRGLDAVKSKLTASYINASFVPVIDFGKTRRKPGVLEGNGENHFRFGAGVFAGYRMGSHSKFVYEQAGDRHRERDHDNFYLTPLRYGIRLQAGFNEVDFFFTYDMNPLFMPNRGPELNAFAFGVTF